MLMRGDIAKKAEKWPVIGWWWHHLVMTIGRGGVWVCSPTKLKKTRTAAARLKPRYKKHGYSHCPTLSNKKYKESKWLWATEQLGKWIVCKKWQFWCHRLESLRNSAKPNSKRVHEQTQQCWKHSHSQSYRSVRPSYFRRWDRGNYKGSAACPIIKGSNSSHFHIPLIFCPVLLSQPRSIRGFFLFLIPFLILENKRSA